MGYGNSGRQFTRLDGPAVYCCQGQIPSLFLVRKRRVMERLEDSRKRKRLDNERINRRLVKHFDQYTKGRKSGIYRLLILDGHENHHSDAFEQYCKKNKIVILYMPACFSYIFQLLDVACFAPLKKAYGTQIKKLVRARISHITKEDFLPAFCDAFKKSIIERNIFAGFQGAGLVPLSPDIVISKLDVKLQTSTSSRPPTWETLPWASRTPNNPTEAISQFEFIKFRIAQHQNSSPTSIYHFID
jgi:hypothetical protein